MIFLPRLLRRAESRSARPRQRERKLHQYKVLERVQVLLATSCKKFQVDSGFGFCVVTESAATSNQASRVGSCLFGWVHRTVVAMSIDAIALLHIEGLEPVTDGLGIEIKAEHRGDASLLSLHVSYRT